MLDFTVESTGFTVKNVFKNRVIEDNWLLHDERNGVSKVMEIDVFDVSSIEKNLSVINVIESHEKVDKGTLTTSTFSDKSNRLTCFNLDVESPQDKISLSSWVSKPNIFEFDVSFHLGKV